MAQGRSERRCSRQASAHAGEVVYRLDDGGSDQHDEQRRQDEQDHRNRQDGRQACEVGEQLDWSWPDWFIYPTGGGTGIIGMWKAFEELEQLGWVTGSKRPKMVSVQSEGCAPIVQAFEAGAERAEPWSSASTIADGLRVPRAVGDFLILRAIRESGGTAIAVSDESMVKDMRELGKLEGISAAPEGGATLSALRTLVDRGVIARDDSVVLFNTGGALKYLEVLETS